MRRRGFLPVSFAIAGLLALTGAASAAPAQSSMADCVVDGVMDRLAENIDLHWHEGEYCHIVNISRVIVTAQPYRKTIYADAAWLLWSMNRDPEAVALLKLGLKNNPNTYYMYDELANYYRIRKKDYATALIYFQQAARFKDCAAETIHGLAGCYEKTNQPRKALAAWKRAATMPEGQAIAIAKVKRLEQELKITPGKEQ